MALFVRSFRAAVKTGVRFGQQSWAQPLVLGLQNQVAKYTVCCQPTTLLSVNKVSNFCQLNLITHAVSRRFYNSYYIHLSIVFTTMFFHLHLQESFVTKRTFSDKAPLTIPYIQDRILLVLRLYDKVDPTKVLLLISLKRKSLYSNYVIGFFLAYSGIPLYEWSWPGFPWSCGSYYGHGRWIW